MAMNSVLRKFLFSCMIIAGLGKNGFTQEIDGIVQDAKTNQGLPSANVFINNTTVGTVTNTNGAFELKFNQEPGEYEIVVSFVGYLPYSTKVSWRQNDIHLGVIRLVPSEIELGGVEVTSTRDDKWEGNFKKFVKVFFGNDKQAGQCKILNPWVIDFEDTKNDNELRAKASAPIQITNNALGYNITFYLANLWSTKDGYIIAGNALFSEMQGKDQKQNKRWKEARRKAYLRSTNHLFRAIIENKINGEGFRLYTPANGYKNATFRSDLFYTELGNTVVAYDTAGIVFRDMASDTYEISLNGSVEVHNLKERTITPVYADVDGAVSWITLSKGKVIVNKDGYPLNPTDVVVSGDMSSDRVAKMLPLDYRPEETKARQRDVYDWSRFQEQIYVHTDKPYYYVGDTIWMKGYVSYNQPAWRDSLSRTAYVELIDRTNQVLVTSKTVRLDSGLFVSELVIPQVPETRNYYLRVYTNLNRNFGDNSMYVKPIPILHTLEFFKSDPDSIPKTSITSALVLQPRTPKFYTGKPIEYEVHVKDDQGEPLAAHLSVSVTDVSKVVPMQIGEPIQTAMTIKEPKLRPFKKQLDYPVEYGVQFLVRADRLDKKVGTTFQVLQVDQANFTTANLGLDGLIHVKDLVFYDTGKFVIKPMSGKKNNTIQYKEEKKAVIPIQFEDVDLKLKREKTQIAEGDPTEMQLKNTKVLKNVEVKASRTTMEKQLDRVDRPYGRPDYVVTRKQLNTSYGNLLQTLPGKVPGLIIRQGVGEGGVSEMFVYLAKGGESSSALNPAEVLVTINDVVVTGKPERILSAIDPNTVETIEVKTGVNVLYGSLGGNGILAVYTRKDFDPIAIKSPSVEVLRVMGYAKPRQFKQQIKNSPSTLYWNPKIKTNDANGNGIISFEAPLAPGKYRMVVEGISSLGEPLFNEVYFEVED
jgi:hypothetical protein